MTKKFAGVVLLLALVAGGYGCDGGDRYEMQTVIANDARYPFAYRMDKRTGEVCGFVPVKGGVRWVGCADSPEDGRGGLIWDEWPEN